MLVVASFRLWLGRYIDGGVYGIRSVRGVFGKDTRHGLNFLRRLESSPAISLARCAVPG